MQRASLLSQVESNEADAEAGGQAIHSCLPLQLARPALRPVLAAFAAACVWTFPRGAFTASSRQPSLSRGLGGARGAPSSVGGSHLQQLQRGQEAGKILAAAGVAGVGAAAVFLSRQRSSRTAAASLGRGRLVLVRAIENDAFDNAPPAPAPPAVKTKKEKVVKDLAGFDEIDGFKPSTFDPSTQVGAIAPLGYFDPLNICKKGEKEAFYRLRANELKHGRVCMLASIGAIGQHYFKLPGFEYTRNNWISQFDSCFSYPGIIGFVIMIAVALCFELSVWSQDEDKEPGNFGDPLGFNMYTEEMRNREISNGRFAMFATLGIVVAQYTTGKDAVAQLGL